jgi:hypothetical protein
MNEANSCAINLLGDGIEGYSTSAPNGFAGFDRGGVFIAFLSKYLQELAFGREGYDPSISFLNSTISNVVIVFDMLASAAIRLKVVSGANPRICRLIKIRSKVFTPFKGSMVLFNTIFCVLPGDKQEQKGADALALMPWVWQLGLEKLGL